VLCKAETVLGSRSHKKPQQSDAAPAPAPTDPHILLNVDGLEKMSQTVTVSYFSHSISLQFKSEENIRKNGPKL
jgi:hypothetical protein